MKNTITKEQFVAVLEAAGINAAQREALHREFERRHPAAHEQFLASLGLAGPEISHLRGRSRGTN